MPSYTLSGTPVPVDGLVSASIAVTNTGTVPILAAPLGRQILPGVSVTLPGWSQVATTLQTDGRAGSADVTLSGSSPAARPGPGAVTLDPGSAASMSVSIAGGSWFTNEGLTAAAVFPVTVTTPTKLYPSAVVNCTITGTVGGVAKALGLRVVEGCDETFRWEASSSAEVAGQATAAGALAFGPLGGSKEQYPMHRLPYALALQIAGTRKGIRWLTYGSSIADYKLRELGWKLMKSYGGQQSGVIVGSWSTSSPSSTLGATSAASITNNATSGTVTAKTADFDAWPSGQLTALNSTGSRTYGAGGGGAMSDTIEIYYITGPASALDGGVFSYQVDGGAVTNVDTSGFAGMYAVHLSVPRAAHQVTVNWVSGNVRIIGPGFIDSTTPGLVPMQVAAGGINLHASSDQAFLNFGMFLEWTQPDVITFEMKTGQIDPAAAGGPYLLAAFKKWLNAIDSAYTDYAGPDVIVIGAPEDSAGTDQRGVNEAMRIECEARRAAGKLNTIFWDGNKLAGTWAQIAAQGGSDDVWDGDGTHTGWSLNAWAAGRMADDLGLFDFPLLTRAGHMKELTYGTIRYRNAAASGAVTLDCSAYSLFDLTLTGNITSLTLSNATVPNSEQEIEIHINQDGTGSRTVAWGGSFRWGGSAAPTLTTTANKRDVFRFRYYGSFGVWVEVSRNLNVG